MHQHPRRTPKRRFMEGRRYVEYGFFVATIGKFLGGEQKVVPVTAQPPGTYDPAQKAFFSPIHRPLRS